MHRRYHQPVASSVHYTTSCKHSLELLRVGEIIARNMLSLFEIINKPLLLHLVCYLYYCIRDAQSQKHHILDVWKTTTSGIRTVVRPYRSLVAIPNTLPLLASWRDVESRNIFHTSAFLWIFALDRYTEICSLTGEGVSRHVQNAESRSPSTSKKRVPPSYAAASQGC